MAGAVTVGLSDQRPDVWADERLRSLDLEVARLVAPWDAATSEPARVQAWLDAVAAAGMAPHVAFEHQRFTRCPSSPCVAPTREQYGRAVRAFLARFPQVRTFTTWNEANHQSQPVASRPELVAAYHDELVGACPACTVVAGDVLDSGAHVRWLQRFRAASRRDPRLWGLHNYGDVTYGRTTGTDAVLAAVPGEVWIEETGGIVTLRNPAGRVTLSTNETRAAASITRAFGLLSARPRITRLYVFHWRADATSRFDSGLVRPDWSARPSLAALQAALRSVAAAPAPVAAKPPPKALRWRATWSRSGRLVVRATCLAAAKRCRGRVVVRLRAGRAARKVATRTYRTTARRPTWTARLAVKRAWRKRARTARRRHVVLTVRPATPAGRTTRTTVSLPRPR